MLIRFGQGQNSCMDWSWLDWVSNNGPIHVQFCSFFLDWSMLPFRSEWSFSRYIPEWTARCSVVGDGARGRSGLVDNLPGRGDLGRWTPSRCASSSATSWWRCWRRTKTEAASGSSEMTSCSARSADAKPAYVQHSARKSQLTVSTPWVSKGVRKV